MTDGMAFIESDSDSMSRAFAFPYTARLTSRSISFISRRPSVISDLLTVSATSSATDA